MNRCRSRILSILSCMILLWNLSGLVPLISITLFKLILTLLSLSYSLRFRWLLGQSFTNNILISHHCFLVSHPI